MYVTRLVNPLVRGATALLMVLSLSVAFGIKPSLAAIDLTQQRQFDIAPQQLSSALLKFSAQSDIQVTVPGQLAEGKKSPGVVGNSTQAARSRYCSRTPHYITTWSTAAPLSLRDHLTAKYREMIFRKSAIPCLPRRPRRSGAFRPANQARASTCIHAAKGGSGLDRGKFRGAVRYHRGRGHRNVDQGVSTL